MNDYFNPTDQLIPFTLARSGQINDLAQKVTEGFDKLPPLASINNGSVTHSATETGSANAYVISLSTAPNSYAEGLAVSFRATNANTGNSTVDVNGLGPVPIKKRGAVELSANDIVAMQMVELRHDGTNFQMVSMPSTSGGDLEDAADFATAAAASASAAAGSAVAADDSADAAALSAVDAAASAASVKYIWGGTSGGSANVQTLTPSPALASYSTGVRVAYVAGVSNTGAATMNSSGLGAKDLKRSDGTALQLGDVINGSLYTLVYDGTNLRLTEGDRDPAAIRAPDVFSGNGVLTAFTLSQDPQTENAIDVFISGVYQPKTAYSVSGTTLTFSVAPANVANNIQVEFRGTQGVTGTPSDGTVSTAKIVDDAVTLAKMEHGTQGEVLVYGASGAPARISGTAGQALVSGGAGVTPSFQDVTGVPVGTPVHTFRRTAPSGYAMMYGQTLNRADYTALLAACCPDIGTTTITIASPAVLTLTAHGLQTGEKTRLKTDGALPTGLNTTTDYYVNRLTADTYSLSLTPGGANINTSGGQSGTHTLQFWGAFGAGNGSTTFTMPDGRGRSPFGNDAMGGTAANIITPASKSQMYGAALGATGGSQEHGLVTAELPAHAHPTNIANGESGTGLPVAQSTVDGANNITSGLAGSTQAHNNMPPGMILNWMIKV